MAVRLPIADAMARFDLDRCHDDNGRVPWPASMTRCGSCRLTSGAPSLYFPFDDATYLEQVGAPADVRRIRYTTLERQ